MHRTCIVCVAVLLAGWTQVEGSYPETREYLLGDMDGIHYDGPGSVDDVYLSPGMQAWAALPHVARIVDFDEVYANQDVPFSIVFPLAENEEVIGATLAFGLRATASLVSTDEVVLYNHDASVYYGPYAFNELGWLPLPSTGSNIRTMNLADLPGEDYLPILQDGLLNAVITDDTAVDYAVLTIEVIPEPAALSLLAIGGLALIRRRCRM